MSEDSEEGTLAQFNWFCDGGVLAVTHDLSARQALIHVGMPIQGGLRAGETRVRAQFELTFGDVTSVKQSGSMSLDSWSEGFTVVRQGNQYSFQIDEVEIVATSVAVRQLEDITDVTPAWSSLHEIFAELGCDPPNSDEWRDAIRKQGMQVEWRLYGGAPRELPSDLESLTGWHLQLVSLVSETSGGLYFDGPKRTPGGFRLALAVSNDTPKVLLRAAGLALLDYDLVSVSCGNQTFDSSTWTTFLKRRPNWPMHEDVRDSFVEGAS